MLADRPLDWPTWLASINLLQVAIVICALFVVVRLLVRFWPWLRKLMAFTDAQAQLPAFIARTDEAIAKMQQQILNNHGDVNMRDELTEALESTRRTEESVQGLHGRLDSVETRIGSLTTSEQAALERIAQIEKTIPRDSLGRFTRREENHD